MLKKYDTTIIGSGISGLVCAIELAELGRSSVVLYKKKLTDNNSYRAQGGISIPVLPEDSSDSHKKDTLNAGNYLNDDQNLSVLMNSTKEIYHWLKERDITFDDKPTREAAHSMNRVLHIGDITGKEIHKGLFAYIQKKSLDITFLEGFATHFYTEGDLIKGLYVLDPDNNIIKIRSNSYVIASGGIGNIYLNTSNSSNLTGDGIVMAWKAGVELSDMEFVQFHPTVFYGEGKRFLLSEALRGEGAKIVDHKGKTFLEKYNSMKELAPRDVVSRAIMDYMFKNDLQSVFLDTTHMGKDFLMKRFPNIYNYCLEAGIDMSKDLIPIRPASHYFIGGINIDKDGKTSKKNLFACGECASSKVHGANRLASNSLLECIVFGIRSARSAYKCDYRNSSYIPEYRYREEIDIDNDDLSELKMKNEKYIGISRDSHGLNELLSYLRKIPNKDELFFSRKDNEFFNMINISIMIAESALKREESRGVHFRSDFPSSKTEFEGHFMVNDNTISFMSSK